MDMGALARRNVNAHASAAEDQRPFVFFLGNHAAYLKANPMEHFGVGIAGVTHAHVLNFPTFLFEMCNHSFL